jgi:amino acid transporter
VSDFSCNFFLQAIGAIVLRIRRPDIPRPFRMWLYPLPALIAACGFVYILFSRPNFLKEIRYAMVLLVLGLAIYLVRSAFRKEWPFGGSITGQAHGVLAASSQDVNTDVQL